MVPIDRLMLAEGVVTLHQIATFVKEPAPLADAIDASPMFDAEGAEGGGVRVEWIALDPDEPVPFPLGRATIHPGGVLLEGFAESRVVELRRELDRLGPVRLTVDETRAFRLEDLLIDPARAMHPLEEAAGKAPTREDIARWYLRAGWPFQPCEALDGRTPYTAVQTGRGRARLEALLEDLGPELARRYPGFPDFDPETLHELLLEPRPRPKPDAATRSRRRAPGRA
ncbi:hypothetical protein K8I85_02565 [bacterium]|nr:hypothetical protein [bacterium]